MLDIFAGILSRGNIMAGIREWISNTFNAGYREYLKNSAPRAAAYVLVGAALMYALPRGCSCHRQPCEMPSDSTKAFLSNEQVTDMIGPKFDLYDAGYDVNGDGTLDFLVKARPGVDRKAYELRQVRDHPGLLVLVEVAGALQGTSPDYGAAVGFVDPNKVDPNTIKRGVDNNPKNRGLTYRLLPGFELDRVK